MSTNKLTSQRKYALRNPERVRMWNKAWRERNKDKVRGYNIKQKDKIKAYRKRWKIEHRDAYMELLRRGRNKPGYKFRSYKNNAKSRGIEFNMTRDEFNKYWNKPCHYCGSEIDTIGLDRKDNKVGYVEGNIVSCCKDCNFLKGSSDYNLFIRKCLEISKNFGQ